MSGLVSETASGRRDRPTEPMLIDTDIHEKLYSKMDLLPYLDDYWQHYFNTYVFNKGPFVPEAVPYGIPKTVRDEWILSDGSAATSLNVLRDQLLDGEGVTTGILCGFMHPSAMQGNFELARTIASAYNDWQIDQWLDQEPRLRGSIHVVAHDPIAAVEEIDRVASNRQLVQVFLPNVTNRQYGDKQYWPIYDACVRHGLALTLHHSGASQTLFGYPNYFIEWHTLAAPFAGVSQLMSLIANGVFDRFPDLKVVLLETGVAWLPWFMWRADEHYQSLRMDVPWVKRRPSDIIRDQVRIATQPLGDVPAKDFLRIVEMAEAQDVFVFATDYPHWDADSADRVLPRTLPDDLLSKIRFENALSTYPRLADLR
jgi:uncharacterized protein